MWHYLSSAFSPRSARTIGCGASPPRPFERFAVVAGQDDHRIIEQPVGFGGPASLLGDRVAVPLRDGDLQVYGFASTAVLYRIAAEKDATIGGDRRSSVTLTSGKLAHVFTHLP